MYYYFTAIDFIYHYFWLIQLILLAILAMSLIGNWMVYQKMGLAGWQGIIPFYNLYVLYEKLYGNGMYALIYLAVFVPMIGGLAVFAANAYTEYRLAQSFRKDIGFTIGLVLCGPVFRLLLGLDRRAKYHQLPPLSLSDIESRLKKK